MNSWATLVLDDIEIVKIGVGINACEGLFSFLGFRLLEPGLALAGLAGSSCSQFCYPKTKKSIIKCQRGKVDSSKSQTPPEPESGAELKFSGPRCPAPSTRSSCPSQNFHGFAVRPLENNSYCLLPTLFCPRPASFNLITSCLAERK